jgi:selT/selW/selH-like putative selenoprotein
VSLADQLSREGFDASAKPGSKGQFDVLNDGELVYSKAKEHRFPEQGEVLSLLQG